MQLLACLFVRYHSSNLVFSVSHCNIVNDKQKWKRSIPVMLLICSHRIFCLRQADTMTETTDCQEQRLTVVLPQYSIPSNPWFTHLLLQVLFPLVHFLYSLTTSQRNHLMQMEHLPYQNCLLPLLPPLLRRLREKACQVKQCLHTSLIMSGLFMLVGSDMQFLDLQTFISNLHPLMNFNTNSEYKSTICATF